MIGRLAVDKGSTSNGNGHTITATSAGRPLVRAPLVCCERPRCDASTPGVPEVTVTTRPTGSLEQVEGLAAEAGDGKCGVKEQE